MTTLATGMVENPDELALFGDDWTSLGKPFADRFRDACRAEAEAHDGWVNPSLVRARLLADGHGDYDPRRLSALWSSTSSKTGYLDKTDRLVPIEGEGSRGNGNKSVRMRRWRGWAGEDV